MPRQISLSRALSAAVLVVSAFFATARAEAAGTGQIFVSNEASHEVIVYSPRDYAIVKRIKTSRRPRDMHFNNAHTHLYVACGDDDVIDVIDLASLTVVDHIPTGPSPEMFEFSADNKLIYLSNEENSSVQVISVADKLIVHEIATGAEPEGISISEDGKTVYATSEIADMVHVIDPVAEVVTANIVVGTRPRRFIMTKAELWVTDELSGDVAIIDRAANTVKQILRFTPPGFRVDDVTPVGITMTKDQKTAFVTLGRANHVAFVDVAAKKITDYILVGSRAWGVDLSRDEKTLYVSNGLSDDVSIIDIPSKKNVRSIPAGRTPHSIIVDD
ncbi:MAG: PQQ-dependent catabolism-associated beta-propeller protein [Bauldia sp.]